MSQERDSRTGTLTSKPFTIERNFISFWIGGGNHPGKTCINLLVDGKVVRTATGHDSNQMRQDGFDVRKLQGKTARLEIVDKATGAWGNIGVGPIVFTDHRPDKGGEQHDCGTLALALLEPVEADQATPALDEGQFPAAAFVAKPQTQPATSSSVRSFASWSWRRPGSDGDVRHRLALPALKLKDGGRFYATRFDNAAAVAEHVAANFASLHAQTRLWHDTWYDSTLPYWFLDRTLSTRRSWPRRPPSLRDGPFYGWEGVGCCEGTCTHVWHYAHAVARLFPELERDLRQRTDFGTAQDPRTGMINHRGEGAGLAVDGQAGCILRAYREHQMSADAAFLKELWPRIKLAMQCLINMDRGRRSPRRGPAQHARSAVVRQDRLAQLALPGGLAGLRGDGPGSGRRRLRPHSPRDLRRAAAGTSTANCSTASITTRFPTRTMSAASARTTAARSTRSSGRAGPSRSAWAASCRRAT